MGYSSETMQQTVYCKSGDGVIDTHGCFDPIKNEYIVPVSGWYQIKLLQNNSETLVRWHLKAGDKISSFIELHRLPDQRWGFLSTLLKLIGKSHYL